MATSTVGLTEFGVNVEAKRLVELCERYGVAELLVFGSVARGVAHKDSDFDLLYVLKPGHHLGFSINRLEDELSELFKRRVDLVGKASLHPVIRDVVLREAKPLYAA
ncbi:MAG: nucleotidyltransferase family protein [Microthrixaceae bacterium]